MAAAAAPREDPAVVAGGRGFDMLAYTNHAYGPQAAPTATGMLPAGAELRWAMQNTAPWLTRVLVTATHKEPRVTAFLATWAYERYWLGQTLAALLPDTRGPVPKARARGLRLGPLGAAIMANMHGRAVIGAHLVEALGDTLLLDALLAKLAGDLDQAVAEPITLMREALARQVTFLRPVAEAELLASHHARLLTRHRLRRNPWPLGLPGPLRGHWAVLRNHLTAGQARVLDRQIGSLPGLTGLRPFANLSHALARN